MYVNETVQVMTKPAYKKLRTVPAVYETVTERVLVKEAGKKLRVIPEKWGTETISYVKKQGATTLSTTPATFSKDSETLEIKPAYAQWELGSPAPDCASSNPDDCRYWCYKGYPAEYKTITKEVLQTKGGLTSWKEVECALLEYSDLNINWNLGSATLTAAAMREIDTKLLPVLA